MYFKNDELFIVLCPTVIIIKYTFVYIYQVFQSYSYHPSITKASRKHKKIKNNKINEKQIKKHSI
jgi:hypothetical protein